MFSESSRSHRRQRLYSELVNRPLLITTILAALAIPLLLGIFLFQQRDITNPVVLTEHGPQGTLFLMEREEGTWRYTAPVSFTLPAPGERIQRLFIMVAASGECLPLAHASLELADGRCRFESDQSFLSSADHLVLTPSACEGAFKQGDVLQGTLSIEFTTDASIGLIGFDAPDKAGLLRVQGKQTQFYASGRVDTLPVQNVARPVDQLSAIWNMPSLPMWIVGAIIVATILFLAGGFALSLPGFQWRRVVACGAFSLALGLLYSIFVPPFHAPDEPDHFLAFSRIAQLPDLEDGARELARVGHFERIHFHRWQRFLPKDMAAPFPIAWASKGSANYHVADSEMEARSALTVDFWQVIGPMFRGLNAPHALLGIRVINAVLWTLACMIGALLIEKLAPPGRRKFPLFLFFIPTLPFFAMHVSNYSFYVQGLTIAAGLGLALFLRGARSNWSGLCLGLVFSFLLVAATGGSTMIAWALALIVSRLMLAINDQTTTLRTAANFWMGLLIGCAPLLLFMGSGEFTLLSQALVKFARKAGFPDSMAAHMDSVFVIGALLFAAALIGLLLEYGVSRLPAIFRRVTDATASWILRILAFLLAALLLVSSFHLFPQLPNDRAMVGNLEYFWTAIHGLFSLFTFRTPDIMLSTTFWTGFGWHDSFMPDRVVRLLSGVTGIGLLAAMARVFSDPPRAIRLLCLFAGAFGVGILVILLVTSGVSGGHPNIHGRYLVGVYLLMVSLGFAGLTPFTRRRTTTEHLAPETLSPYTLRTALELLTAWAGLITMAFTPFILSGNPPYPIMSLGLIWPVAVFAVAGSFATLGILLLWSRLPVDTGHTIRTIAPRPGFIYGLTAIIACILISLELWIGIPKSVHYAPGFYVVLITAIAAAILIGLLAPRWSTTLRWLSPAALVLGAALHVGCLLFITIRYFG